VIGGLYLVSTPTLPEWEKLDLVECGFWRL
jgi:hypothetical protein